ncbi:MAG TPA: hypothetical protein VHO50_03940 [Bacteroidales bacterium]|nr:hypothetical protein [Bacteroidales bacterium]
MKILSIAFLVSILILGGCKGLTSPKDSANETDTITVADTGFTGITKYSDGAMIRSEVTFKNGVKNGLTKTYYQSGKLQRTFWFVDGLRQDSSCWYYEEGQLFRTTRYINDTIHGIQKQYYRTGELKAEMEYQKGYRTLYFKEYLKNGKLVKDYPELIVKTEDKYNSNGTFRILLEMSDSKANVNYFRGDFINGAYDTTRVNKIEKNTNKCFLELKKTTSEGSSQVGIIAEVLTDFGNRLLIYRKIDLPYSDLK